MHTAGNERRPLTSIVAMGMHMNDCSGGDLNVAHERGENSQPTLYHRPMEHGERNVSGGGKRRATQLTVRRIS